MDPIVDYIHIFQLSLSTRNITNHDNNIYPQKYIIFLGKKCRIIPQVPKEMKMASHIIWMDPRKFEATTKEKMWDEACSRCDLQKNR